MFLMVAEERSFTRAAAKLGLSQSALSHAMRRLEARLGLRLLTRTTRSVAPTEAGERLIETLRPALDEIDLKLASLTELRDRPAGTVRITTSLHAARTLLWPAISRLTTENLNIEVELNIDAGFTDIVAQRFDAGVRLGESLEKDMIAVRIGPRLRMAAVAAPFYLARRGKPETPHDLGKHSCINLRLPTSGGLYVWEFERGGRELRVRVEGQLVFNDVDLIVGAAVAGHGIAFMLEDHVASNSPRGLSCGCSRIGASPSMAIICIIPAGANLRRRSRWFWPRFITEGKVGGPPDAPLASSAPPCRFSPFPLDPADERASPKPSILFILT